MSQSSGAIPSSADLQRYVTAALDARRRGDAAEERRHLDAALAIEPANPQLLNARGMCALAMNDAADARARFQAATASDPDQPILWINLATACRSLNDDTGEEASLDHALAIDRLNLTAQIRLADLHQRLHRTIRAVQSWSNVVQMIAPMTDRSPALEDALTRGRTYLAAQTSALGETLSATLGDTITAAGPDARRVTACLDNLMGRRRIYPNVCAGLHVPFLPADEFFDDRLFPWFGALERQTDAIRAEALSLVERSVPGIRPYVRQDAGVPPNQWSALDNNLDWSACFLWEYGVRDDAICELCPQTAAALAAIPQNDSPGKAPTAFFSILRPHAHIPAHTGVTNSRTIIHLPLVVPDDCRFRVGGETRRWQEGRAFGFDDTIEHEAWNDSDASRIVLIFDVWNPHLTAQEQAMLKEVFRITGQGVDEA